MGIPIQAEWAFWIISLTMSIFSISFAFLAFKYANKASKRLKEVVEDSFISSSAAKIFFQDLKLDLSRNKNLIVSLESDEDISYKEYNINASISRLNPVPLRINKAIEETEFKNLIKLYKETKREFDRQYNTIFSNDFSILNTQRKISPTKRKTLISYHKELIKNIKYILSSYTEIVSKKTNMI